MSKLIVYGIKNCDTVKKALDWLNAHQVSFDFHDYKLKGVEGDKLKRWSKQVGWESLINRKGTTWRKLDEGVRESVKDEPSAVKIMKERTSVIKRPILEKDNRIILIGYDESQLSNELL